jgi:hypothetical protein
MPYSPPAQEGGQYRLNVTNVGDLMTAAAARSRAATVLVAANNAPTAVKNAADYLCDGTDDEVQINQAATDIGSTGKLQLSEGTFSINNGGVVCNGHSVTIEGAGRGHRANATHGASAIGTRLIAASGITGPILTVAAASGSEPLYGSFLKDFSIDGAGLGTTIDGIFWRSYWGHIFNVGVRRTTGHGIHFKGYRIAAGDAQDWNLYDSKVLMCDVESAALDSLYFDYGATDMHVMNCVLANGTRDHIHMANAASSAQFTGVHTYDAGRYNIHLESTGSRSKFSNCKIEGAAQHGLVIDSTNGGPSDVQFTGCNFHDNGDSADNTYDHVFLTRASGTSSIGRLMFVGCAFGWKNQASNPNKPRYGINLVGSISNGTVVVGNSFGSTAFGTAAINYPGGAIATVRGNQGQVDLPTLTYTPTNVTTDRSFDANSYTMDELADVLGTLIQDLQARGVFS